MSAELDANREEITRWFEMSLEGRHPTLSYMRLLHDEGEWFELAGANPRLGMGGQGFCFFNARHAVRAHPGEFSYVEGFARNEQTGLPMLHAWVVDRQNRAWDVTWPWDQPEVGALCGLRVPRNALDGHWMTCGAASFLADYYHRFPSLQVPVREWNTRLPLLLGEIRSTHCMAEVRAGRARLMRNGSIKHLSL